MFKLRLAVFPEKTAEDPTGDPPTKTLTLVILAVLPEPRLATVRVVRVTAALLGLFMLTWTAVTFTAPGSSGRVPVAPVPSATTDEVGVELEVEVRVKVPVGVEVNDPVGVGVLVMVGVSVTVGVSVFVVVKVRVGVPVKVPVGVGVDVWVGVPVAVGE